MGSMRTILVIAAVAITIGNQAVHAQAVTRIGVFDSQRVIQETADGKRVQARIEAMQSAKQAELKAKEEQITELRTQLSQQALSLSAERRSSMEMDIQRKILELENAQELANQEMRLELSRAQQEFNDRLLAAVEAYGREQGFDLLLEFGVIAWAGASIDVTTGLIDRINQMYPEPAGTATP